MCLVSKCLPSGLHQIFSNHFCLSIVCTAHRSSLTDAEKAISIQSDYEKAEIRVAQCLWHLKRYENCLAACTKYADKYGGTNDKITDLRKNAREAHLKQLRDQRKLANEIKKKGECLSRTVAELTKRRIRFEEQTERTRIQDILRPIYVPLEEFPIHIDEFNGDSLIWPAVFCYPEFEFCDFQQELNDNVT